MDENQIVDCEGVTTFTESEWDTWIETMSDETLIYLSEHCDRYVMD